MEHIMTNQNPYEKMLTRQEVLTLLNIGTYCLRSLNKRKLLRPRKVGKRHLYTKEDIKNFLANLPIADEYKTPEEIRRENRVQK